MDNKKWFVMITKSRAEKQVSKRLTEIGVENFLPLHKQLHIWHDRKKWVDVPLFFSYIFIKTEDRFRSKVFEAGGLVKYVSIGGKIAILSEDEISRIRCLCNYLGEVAIEQGNVKEGDEVEILTGHFAGFRGQLLHIDGKDRLKISIKGLGCYATVELDKEMVRRASEELVMAY